MAVTRKIPARFNHVKKEIVLYRWFAEKAEYPGTSEYKTLIQITNDFPTYSVVVRDKINQKEGQEHYKGLTYEYMETYIKKYEPKETREAVLKEFEDKLFISECHSKGRRYPAIKKWFLEKYPEVAKFGIPNSNMPTEESQDEETNINAEPEFQKAS